MKSNKDFRKAMKNLQLLHDKTAGIYEEMSEKIIAIGENHEFLRGLHNKLYKVLCKAKGFEKSSEENEEEENDEEYEV